MFKFRIAHILHRVPLAASGRQCSFEFFQRSPHSRLHFLPPSFAKPSSFRSTPPSPNIIATYVKIFWFILCCFYVYFNNGHNNVHRQNFHPHPILRISEDQCLLVFPTSSSPTELRKNTKIAFLTQQLLAEGDDRQTAVSPALFRSAVDSRETPFFQTINSS